jgi:putative RecB family exonuclease
MAYALLAEKALGIKAKKGSYLYLRSGHLKSFEITEEEKKKTKERIGKIAQRIGEEEEFPPRPTKICNWCDYLEFCPAKEQATKLIAQFKGEESDGLPF